MLCSSKSPLRNSYLSGIISPNLSSCPRGKFEDRRLSSLEVPLYLSVYDRASTDRAWTEREFTAMLERNARSNRVPTKTRRQGPEAPRSKGLEPGNVRPRNRHGAIVHLGGRAGQERSSPQHIVQALRYLWFKPAAAFEEPGLG